jgi:ribosomal protein S18 acetylase RimI-like enzyme
MGAMSVGRVRIERLDRIRIDADLPALLEMDRHTLGEYWAAVHFLAELPHKWELSRIAVDAEHRPVAFCVMSLKPASVHTHRIAVAPELRGHGLALRLWDSVREDAINLGVARMTLKVHSANETMIHVVGKLGFRLEQVRGSNLEYAVSFDVLRQAVSRNWTHT